MFSGGIDKQQQVVRGEYPEPSQTSKMELFVKLVNNF